MSIKFNNTEITDIVFNDTTLCKLIYNGTLAWENHGYGEWKTTTAASCTAVGSSKRTCTRCSAYETKDLPALGHSWKDATYSWGGTTSCTATRVCNRYSGHTQTSNGTVTSKVTTAATCTAKGTTTYTSSFPDSWAATQTKTAQDVAINSSNHTGSAVNGGTQGVHSKYSCCGATVSTVHNYTSSVQTPATCTTMGTTKYTCSCGYNYTAQDIPATGHSWNNTTYSWNSDKSKCTATRTCKNATHPETETVNSTNAVTTAATCTTDGVRTYTATFTKSWASKQTTTSTIPKLGHAYSTPTYSWTGTTSCIATRVCSNDATHKETSTATITSKVTTPATCTTKGTTTYTATFTDSWATTQTKTAQDVAINSSNHTGSVVNGGTQSVHTKYSCCGATVSAAHSYSSSVQTAATCTDKGTTKYTCSCGYNYTAQDIAATGHSWNSPDFTWNNTSEPTSCTATRTCKNDSSHKEVANSTKVTKTINTPATCATKGKVTYNAFFDESWADQKATIVLNIPVTNEHTYANPTYSWSGTTSCTATRTCSTCGAAKETETSKAITSKLISSPTCTTPGSREYYASFDASWASRQTKTVAVPATGHTWKAATCTTPKTCSTCGTTEGSAAGHSWGTTNYSWGGSGTNKTCTATRTCSTCNTTQTANGYVVYSTTKEPTTSATGTREYRATFSEVWASSRTTTETLPKRLVAPGCNGVGFNYSDPVTGENYYRVDIANENDVAVTCYITLYDEDGVVYFSFNYPIAAGGNLVKDVCTDSSPECSTYSVYFTAYNYSDSVKVTGTIS